MGSINAGDRSQQWLFNRCSSKDSFKLYLDAGHGQNNRGNGAYDPGAVSLGYEEHSLAVDLARKIAAICRDQYGLCVFTNDDGGYYRERHAEAVRLGCSTLVSLHFNSGGGTGTETYIHSDNAAAGSTILQDIIHRRTVVGTALLDRGQKADSFAVVGGQLPAVLIEIAFIDNASDMGRYASRVNQIASQIAAGIDEAAQNSACLG